jgi:integrase
MRVPTYRKHSLRDFAFVQWNGKRHRLPGRYDSIESRRAFAAFLAEHVYTDKPKADTSPPVIPHPALTITELVLAYLDYAKQYYPAGKRNGTYFNVRRILLAFENHCGDQEVKQFGSGKLYDYQAKLVTTKRSKSEETLSRTYINKHIGAIQQMFKWGVGRELVPADVYLKVSTVRQLAATKTTARETAPRSSISFERDVQPALPFMQPVVRDMVMIQWLTGVRSESVCEAKPEQFATGSDIWLWRPRHKMEHKKAIMIPVGPQAQAILTPYLAREPGKYLFNPQEGRRGNNWRYRDHYDADTYRRSIQRSQTMANAAAKKAGTEIALVEWFPHQIRHTVKDTLEREFGVEAARILLGHSSVNTTLLYGERDLSTAIEIARRRG